MVHGEQGAFAAGPRPDGGHARRSQADASWRQVRPGSGRSRAAGAPGRRGRAPLSGGIVLAVGAPQWWALPGCGRAPAAGAPRQLYEP